MKSKIKILKRKIAFLVGPIAKYVLRENHRRANVYAKYYDDLPIQKNTILYESRDGNSITDNPYAMFKYMLNNPAYQDYVHIWSIQDFNAVQPVIDLYKQYTNVKFVQRNSKEYLKYLASCEYLINNSTFQTFYIPKDGQTYINTWHGTPLKHMGFDIPGNPAQNQNVLRNFLSADYILSPNTHTTKVYTESYKLRGLYEGKIIEEGYPRIDLTLNTDRNKFMIYLRSLGIKMDEKKKNILYAPTWKGNSVSTPKDDVLQIIADMSELASKVGNEYNILIKVHPFLYKQATSYAELNGKLIPDYIDANELQSIVDVLITDYSSIFFDFLVTGRPILFYAWDADVYSEERGQYFPNEALPGPILYNAKELVNAIQNLEQVQNDCRANYENMQNQFVNYEDGKVTARITDTLILRNGNQLNEISVYNDKEKIIIYPGGMRDNGITSSFINLMNNIDFERFDVTCFTQSSNTQEVLKNLDRVNKNVRFLFKPGIPAYRLFEVYKDKFVHNRGERGYLGKKFYPEKAYKRESRRLFGNTHFDYTIDFSGYSLFWAKYLLALDAKRKICFMHNDLLSDSERKVKGKRPHRINLRGLFSVYHRFDKLVSVSVGTMELNKKNLIEYADADKFDYVLNTINPDKILGTSQNDQEAIGHTENKVETTSLKSHGILRNVTDFPVWNTIPGNINASTFQLDKSYENAVVLIIREAKVGEETLYKFSYKNQSIGWINNNAIELTDDQPLSEVTVDRIAKIEKTKGHSIRTEPYNLPGSKRVSGLDDYKGILFTVDKETETIHGTYCRVSIGETILGWIDKRALQFLPEMEQAKRDKMLSQNYTKYHELVESLPNRILEETFFEEKTFATITNPGNKVIWTKAYPSYKSKKKADAMEYKDELAELKRISKTAKGTYYHFSIAGKISGYLETSAFDFVDGPVLVKEKEVSKLAIIVETVGISLWTKPELQEDAQLIEEDLSDLQGKQVVIKKEAETTETTYCLIELDGKELGWIDGAALEVQELLGAYIDGRFVPYPSEGYLNFVNMGRLSPEKAQGNLIEAFGKFHEQHPNSRLYILGKGPLKDDLERLIKKLNIADSVFLMGQLDNPFPFLKKCDCFVLSSHYEGQPMVLLETMTLGMKIMATDIVANRTVLEDGKYGLLVEDSVDGLEKGLTYVAENFEEFQPAKFDYVNYNKEAMDSFLRVLEGR
ncbi:CDP-glycerol glycerophosphotransferase family protein [Caldibacillus lycopersici]|uniref:CDP-glycerol glycerophosphotransferase family protein n=1 Tax=Perspicuibacillus lycopersici TaxID=1325689 RepID=A0AAE3ITD1_9BACI|nr:CDP-glycerol glycerophosphotransferase family protein [Perspicuibacillus lycopersici]MCU9613263.1 CDP-glycerol glycerophosphotransferase family protein [Perspicuibacillus lycopersici]